MQNEKEVRVYIVEGRAVMSPSDLTSASRCEFAFLRRLDARLGRIDRVETAEDRMLDRAARLGDAHEETVLESYLARFGRAGTAEAIDGGVALVERPDLRDPDAVSAALAATAAGFRDGAAVVFQATFVDESFVGFADFIIRSADGRYRVQDSKLARSAKVTALLQLAAYAERLAEAGVPVDDEVDLLLGDGSTSVHRLADIAPVYRKRRARLEAIVAERMTEPEPLVWGDERYSVCGQCDVCATEIAATRDVLLVAGLRVAQRDSLRAAGIRTIDDLAAIGESSRFIDPTVESVEEITAEGTADGSFSTGPASTAGSTLLRISAATLAALSSQARLQVLALDSPEPSGRPPIEVYAPGALRAVPEPSPGDIFFDFEGDPLYTEGGGADTDRDRWGLDYLFGFVDTANEFTAYWAHTFAEERSALRAFLDDLAERRAIDPGLHVYHYASYERTHLLSLAARHDVGVDEVDGLLRDGVLIDLYPIVRRSVRVGSPSYSIKKLEPLYMGDELRDGEVTNAAASIVEYADARSLIDGGRPADIAEGERKLAEIADYNRYDCVSTLRLRDWLLQRAVDFAVVPGTADDLEARLIPPASELYSDLVRLAGDPLDPRRSPERTAYAFAAAALDFHRREAKSFWWEHFARLSYPLDEWIDGKGVFRVDSVVVDRDWYREGRQRVDRRLLHIRGEMASGGAFSASPISKPFLVYAEDASVRAAADRDGERHAHPATIIDVNDDGSLTIEETQPRDLEQFDDLPLAVTPSPPPPAGKQQGAIAEWAQSILEARRNAEAIDVASGRSSADVEAADSDPRAWPRDPVSDLMRRLRPRTRSGRLAPVRPTDDDEHHGSDRGAGASSGTPDTITAVVSSCLDLDDSYLAVQGPPGTGKTYLGSHVIERLVRVHRWRIGVVAQSHAVVDNLLTAVVAAGLPGELVGKKASSSAGPDDELPPYTLLGDNGHAGFAAENVATGFVVGGTAWDFANTDRVPRRSLDLLVIDEAGQFSLAFTAAAAVSARNLLLLGDPQQLPQVSQGIHPEPIDQSALGWISAGHDVLPAEFGYFLAESRRMHPAVAAPVSELSYEGSLRAHPVASERSLAGLAPGVHPIAVAHVGNANSSPEEAGLVVELVRRHLGASWSDPSEHRPDSTIGQGDVIVVTPYNAQLDLIRTALDEVGLGEVRVGTVDKFQGQEAAISIVSLAASSAADVPRGLAFLIQKNRLNVAISRAKWASYVVYSAALLDHLPPTPVGLAELSRFITLVEPGPHPVDTAGSARDTRAAASLQQEGRPE